jgi:hypothetical protein
MSRGEQKKTRRDFFYFLTRGNCIALWFFLFFALLRFIALLQFRDKSIRLT